MNPRTTWILAFVAAALGAFIWLYEIRGEADRSAAQAAAKRIFVGVEPDDVDWVELRTRDGVDARLERDASARWRLDGGAARQRLVVPLDQFRFVVPGVHLAGATVDKDPDHPLRR